MIYFYTITNKNAILEEGSGITARDGSPACSWDLKDRINMWAIGMTKDFEFKSEYFKYYNCVATINCETPAEAFHLTNSEEAFAYNHLHSNPVTPLTGSGNIPSMSVGDIVLVKDEFFMCMGHGWRLLDKLTAERAESMKKTEALRYSVLEDYEYEKKHYNKGGA
tara:strand:+ start:444 stop:938 length:495 start_codon:yes stop_codon:yes gene_type:complete